MAHKKARRKTREEREPDPWKRASRAIEETVRGYRELPLQTRHHLIEHGQMMAGMADVERWKRRECGPLMMRVLAYIHSDWSRYPGSLEKFMGALRESLVEACEPCELNRMLYPEKGAGLSKEKEWNMVSEKLDFFFKRAQEFRRGSRLLREFYVGVEGFRSYSEAVVNGAAKPESLLEMINHLVLDGRNPGRLKRIIGRKGYDDLCIFLVKWYANIARMWGLHNAEQRLLTMGVSHLWKEEYDSMAAINQQKRGAYLETETVLQKMVSEFMSNVVRNKWGKEIADKATVTTRRKSVAKRALKLVEKGEGKKETDDVGIRIVFYVDKCVAEEIGLELANWLGKREKEGKNKVKGTKYLIKDIDNRYRTSGIYSGMQINLHIIAKEGIIGAEIQVRGPETDEKCRNGEAADAIYQSRLDKREAGSEIITPQAYVILEPYAELIRPQRPGVFMSDFRNFHVTTIDGWRTEDLVLVDEKGLTVIDLAHKVFGSRGLDKSVTVVEPKGISLLDQCPKTKPKTKSSEGITITLRIEDEDGNLKPGMLRELAAKAVKSETKEALKKRGKRRK